MSADIVDGGARGTASTSRPLAFTSNHAQRGAVAGRAEAQRDQIAALLRAVLPPVARQLMAEIPPSQRTDFETQSLKDCIRDRRNVSPETQVTVIDISSRRPSTRHVLSDAIRSVELSIAPSFLMSVDEASRAEQIEDAATDMEQLVVAEQKTATHIESLRQKALRHIARLRDLADSCSWTLARRPR